MYAPHKSAPRPAQYAVPAGVARQVARFLDEEKPADEAAAVSRRFGVALPARVAQYLAAARPFRQ